MNLTVTVGLLLLGHSAVCTVDSLSLLYLLLISRFEWIWRWNIDELGTFHANQTSICLDAYKIYGWGWPRYRQICFRPPVFLLTVPRRSFFCGSFFVICVLCVFVILSCMLLAAFWSPVGKVLISWLSNMLCCRVLLTLSHMVSWVRFLNRIVSIPDLCLLSYSEKKIVWTTCGFRELRCVVYD